jgi:dTDP-4-amino-4,6-dideoxygalactose transaminase
LPFPLEDPACRLNAWARHGIFHGVRRLGLGPGDVVLVPAYHHGSEVEALVRAGVTCRFYEAQADLEPDEAELEGLLDESVRALHLTHVLGFPLDAGRWRRWCDRRRLLLIEDAAQAWLATRDGRPAGSTGDLAVFCLYKTVGLPEGCATIQASPAEPVPIDRRFGVKELVRRHGMWLAGRSATAHALSRPWRRRKPYDARRDFDLRDPTVGPWRHTPYVLRRVADPAVAERRREHYALLLDWLRPVVPRPFDVLPAGASPLGLPIVVSDRAGIASRLAAAGVATLELWRVPHPALAVDDFPGAAARRQRTLVLPVHQELRLRDVRRIADAVDWAMDGDAGTGAPAPKR